MTWIQADESGRPLDALDGSGAIPLVTAADQTELFPTEERWPYARNANPSDGLVVHITARQGESHARPLYVRGLNPVQRLALILNYRALLACRQFDHSKGFPGVCFTGGDESSRAALWTEYRERYRPWGLAFRSRTIEAWGAHEVAYFDAREAHRHHSRLTDDIWKQDLRLTHQDLGMDVGEPDPTIRKTELQLARSLILRDDPGGEDALGRVTPPHQWRHELEWRLLFPSYKHERALWTFEVDEVDHLLVPQGEEGKLRGLAQWMEERSQLIPYPVRLVTDNPETGQQQFGTLPDWL